MQTTTIQGQYVDILNKRIYPATLLIQEGMIVSITECTTAPNQFILPGFIDSHVHIESSMLVPSSFARLAVVHGTIGTISDPHEIANVCGLEGVQYMIDNGKKVPFHFSLVHQAVYLQRHLKLQEQLLIVSLQQSSWLLQTFII